MNASKKYSISLTSQPCLVHLNINQKPIFKIVPNAFAKIVNIWRHIIYSLFLVTMNHMNKWIMFSISFQIAWHWNSWTNTGHSWCEKLCHKHKKQLNQFWLKKLTNSYFTCLSERCCTTEKRIQLKRELNVKASIYCFYELLSRLCVSQWQWNKFCNKKSFSSCILIKFYVILIIF